MRKLIGTVAAVAFVSIPLFGQVNAVGSLHGLITDQQDAAVPQAVIELQNTGTGARQTQVSTSDGSYAFGRVTPGKYKVTAKKDGFQTASRDGIVIDVNDAVVADFQLQVGQTTEAITVGVGAEALKSQSTEISLLVGERRISDLPLNGRNFQILTLLTPGVGTVGAYNNPTISGTRFSTNTFTLDGADSSDERTPQGVSSYAGAAGFATGFLGAPSVIPTESLQEFRMVAANADATFGRGSGGQIEMVTKSGTSVFHGSGYEYLRNNDFDARDFFNRGPFLDSQGRAKVPPFKFNLFGASLGGPILLPGPGNARREKHFFFVNYEGYRQRLQAQTNVSAVVPNAALISMMPGDLGKLYKAFYVDRGIVPTTGNPAGQFIPLAPTSAAAAPYLAAGFDPALVNGAGTVLLNLTPTSNIDQNAIVARTDHHWTDRWSSSFRFIGNRSNQLSNPTTGLAADLSKGIQHWYAGTAGIIFAATPRQIFEARASIQRSEYQTGSAGGTDPRLTTIGVSGSYGLTITSTATGLANLAVVPGAGFLDNQNVPQLSLLHTYTHGRLTLRSGVDVRWIQANVANYSGTTPAYTFTGFLGANGLLGTAANQPEAIAASARATSLFGSNGGPTTALRGWRSTTQEYFTQADWRVRRDLTVNLGLRYSYTGVYHEANHAMSNLYAVDSSGTIHDDVSPFAYGRFSYQIGLLNAHPFYQPDRNNLQPRAGIAWNIAGRSRTVVRAGFGTYFDRISQIDFTSNITNAPLVVAGAGANVAFRLGSAIPPGAASIDFFGVNPAIRNPYAHQWNIAVEEKLDSATSVSVAYVGTRGRSLLSQTDPNGGASVPTANRPDPRYGRIRILSNTSSSNYNALQTLIARRLTRGLDFTLAYTYAESHDDYSFDYLAPPPMLINLGANPNAPGFSGGGAQFVNRPRTADWAPSNFDIRHNLTLSYVYELPFGRGRAFGRNIPRWLNAIAGDYSLSGIYIFRTGDPFTITWGSDIYQVGDTAQARPALVQGALSDLYAHTSEKTRYLIPQADARPRLAIPDPVSNPFLAIGRNSGRSPSFSNLDATLRKAFAIRERLKMSIEASAFNILNHPNFAAPVAVLSDVRFGTIVASRSGSSPRQLQLGLRLSF
jgi:Carboxypeptidase regulatory-like domain